MSDIKYSDQLRAILADPIKAEITACKVKFLMDNPFIGQIATRLESVEAPWCRTGATDGRHLYWNREFMKSLNRDQKLFFIAHEVYHICFLPGTMVAGDCRAIEEYQVGDSLIGLGGTRSTVTSTMENHYDGDIFTIKPRGMLPLSMTESHPILVSRPVWKSVEAKDSPTGTRTNIRVWSEPEWVHAKNLKKNDWVQIPRVQGHVKDYTMDFEFLANKWSSPEKIQGEIILDEKLARFIGYYVAEGSTSTTNDDHYSAIALNASERKECEELKEILSEYFGISSNIQPAGDNGIKLQFSSAPLGRWLIKHCGKGAHNKKIPECILYNTETSILESFLHAYICGDGNVNKNYGVHSATVSRSLALQVQLAWARLGVFSNITLNKNNGGIIKATGQVIKSGVIYKLTTKAEKALSLFGLENPVKRQTKYFRLTDDAIWVPITNVSHHAYTGLVYNLETSCHTYAVQSVMTHNCFDHVGRRGNRDPAIWNMACLAWDTPILMADGSVQPIQRVLPGDYIASPFGPNKVLGNMFSGIKETMEYGVQNNTIRSTTDHKYFTTDGVFLNAEKISRSEYDGHVFNLPRSEEIRFGKLFQTFSNGFVEPVGSGIQHGSKFSIQERLDCESIFAQAVQLAALRIYAASGVSLSSRSSGRRGYDNGAIAREVFASYADSNQHITSYEGMVGSERFFIYGEEKQSRKAIFLDNVEWLGNRSAIEDVASISRDQEAARLMLAENYRTSSESESVFSAITRNLGFGSRDKGIECSRFSVRKGSNAFRPVFDLVTAFGSFFANGILTHNCDYNINYSLKREGIGSPPARDGKEYILYDERYTDDMSAYEIYDLLIENSTTIELPLDEHLDLQGDDDGDDGDNESDSGDGGDQEGEGNGEEEADDGSGSGKKQKTTKVRVLGKDGPPKLSKEEIDKLRQEIRSNIISAAQQAGAGSIPAGLRKMINQLVEPKLDWRSLLDAYIRSSIKDDYSFQNISRRSWGMSGAILPGQKFTERVEVFCAIDASGSTTQDMVTDFLSEVTGIVVCFPDFKIDLVSFDTEVYNHVVITPDNIDELYKYEIRGNGGTMFECVYEYMKREGIEPERLVFLTDGLPNSSWGDPNYSDTIFIIHSNSHIVAPFGITAHYERKGK